MKRLDKWVPHEVTAIFKNCHFEVLSSLVLLNNNDPFLDWIMTYDKSEFYMTTSDGHICTKKKGPGHWWSAASLIHHSFLNPGKTITSEKNVQ